MEMSREEMRALLVYELYCLDGAGEIKSIHSFTSIDKAAVNYESATGFKQLWELLGDKRILLKDNRFTLKQKHTQLRVLDDYTALKIKL